MGYLLSLDRKLVLPPMFIREVTFSRESAIPEFCRGGGVSGGKNRDLIKRPLSRDGAG